MVGEGSEDGVSDLVQLALVNEGDRGAAETAACHSGADGPGVQGCVDGEVEFEAGDFIIVTQRDMRGGHQFADAAQIALAQPPHRLQHSAVFAQHMPDSAGGFIVEDVEGAGCG